VTADNAGFEHRQLVDQLRRLGVDGEVCDRLERAAECILNDAAALTTAAIALVDVIDCNEYDVDLANLWELADLRGTVNRRGWPLIVRPLDWDAIHEAAIKTVAAAGVDAIEEWLR
jgi:hypothetical protein